LCKCPKLSDNNTCSIYKERFELNIPYSWVDYKIQEDGNIDIIQAKCGLIKQILKNKGLPKEIEDQCCFAHPELLEREYEQIKKP
jgi:hypothetical protein